MVREQGKIGYVFARTRQRRHPVKHWPTTRRPATSHARGFLAAADEGPQRRSREGAHVINPALFVDDRGRLTDIAREAEQPTTTRCAKVLDQRKAFPPVVIRGASGGAELDLPAVIGARWSRPWRDDLLAPDVAQLVQEPEAFLPRRLPGRQEARVGRGAPTAESAVRHRGADQRRSSVGYVGVVVSYTAAGKDVSGSDYTHGELVESGYRGINGATDARQVRVQYIRGQDRARTNHLVGSPAADSNRHIDHQRRVRAPAALSVVVHIDYKKAPMVGSASAT
jgi:hypothetical protein